MTCNATAGKRHIAAQNAGELMTNLTQASKRSPKEYGPGNLAEQAGGLGKIFSGREGG